MKELRKKEGKWKTSLKGKQILKQEKKGRKLIIINYLPSLPGHGAT